MAIPRRLARDIAALRRRLVAAAASPRLELVHPRHRASATNLLHFLALRRHDLRDLQEELSARGLSSLGRCESDVLEQVIAIEEALAGTWKRRPRPHRGRAPLLEEHTAEVLGEPSRERGHVARIMATAPSEAADDPQVLLALVRAGIDCLRINCAHDDASAWMRMVGHLRAAVAEVGRPCRVVMDLAGPKLRTGPLPAVAGVIKARPVRDALGRVVEPAKIWLHPRAAPTPAPCPAACVPIAGEELPRLRVGDQLTVVDARGSHRRLEVMAANARGVLTHCAHTIYLVGGTTLQVRGRHARHRDVAMTVADLPPAEGEMRLRVGDRLQLTSNPAPGSAPTRDRDGRQRGPARISCTEPRVFPRLRAGQRVFFDDGHIGGRIVSRSARGALIAITAAKARGSLLRSGRGINFPDATLDIPALTGKDLADLDTVVALADAVSMSFAQRPQDVRRLRRELVRRRRGDLPIVLKIETKRGFTRLPDLLLEAMSGACSGAVMIARGDLAVECGYERLAEVQEEILWICEAAHVPAIWATQVLESLAKQGLPSRAEITDAAMGGRAECVMLNKGLHAAEAIVALNDILRRSESHHRKKRTLLRRLRSW